MRINLTYKRAILSVLLVAGLVGCQTNQELAGPPLLNGNWASNDGVYVAQLRNGNFQAIANDTGGVISQGNYVALPEKKVQLTWQGVVSGNSNSADCVLTTADRMDCVMATGAKFSLTRA